MPAIDHQNFDAMMPPELRDEFWRRVKFALRHFYGSTGDLADEYRETIEKSSVLGQLLVYHMDPLHIAADLVDAPDGGAQFASAFRQRYPDPFG